MVPQRQSHVSCVLAELSVHISTSIDYGTILFRTVLCIYDALRVTNTVLCAVTCAC